jgi:AraC family transcriptional regulator
MKKDAGRDDMQDLMVSMNILPIQDLNTQGLKQRDLKTDYWQGMIPKDHPEINSTPSWIIVHTVSHSLPFLEQSAQHGTSRILNTENENNYSTDNSSFCGWDKPVSFIQLGLSHQYLQKITAEVGPSRLLSSRNMQVLHTREPKILQIGAWLFQEFLKGGAVGSLSVDSLVNLLALQIFDLFNQQVEPASPIDRSLPASQDVARAIEYMQAHLNREISLAELSQVVHISPSQLGRLFKRATSLTPHQYLIRLRVGQASELLRSGRLPISEVALQSGFNDQSHLNRHFKRIYGVTPKTIRNGISSR